MEVGFAENPHGGVKMKERLRPFEGATAPMLVDLIKTYFQSGTTKRTLNHSPPTSLLV